MLPERGELVLGEWERSPLALPEQSVRVSVQFAALVLLWGQRRGVPVSVPQRVPVPVP